MAIVVETTMIIAVVASNYTEALVWGLVGGALVGGGFEVTSAVCVGLKPIDNKLILESRKLRFRKQEVLEALMRNMQCGLTRSMVWQKALASVGREACFRLLEEALAVWVTKAN